MSIIHDALKKAAAEGEGAYERSSTLQFHSEKSLHPIYAKLITLFFLGALLSFSLLYLNAQGRRPLTPDQSGASFSPPPEEAPPAPGEKSSAMKTEFGAVQDRRREEGDRFLKEGLDLYHEGKFDQSFIKAVSFPSLSAVAHNNLGLTLRSQGKAGEAIAHYEAAIRLDPDYAEAHNNLGMAYDRLGSIDQSGDHYEKAIHLNPSVSAFHLNYATWLERKGAFAEARREYRIYLRLASDRIKDGLGSDQGDETVALVKSHLKQPKGL
ncbi:MAG: tetratricopeptide repeat protein [Nitrospiria bacterium]